MKTAEFLSYLRSLDIRLSIEEDRLRINAPKGVVTLELRDQIVARKAEILAFLQSTACSSLVDSSSLPVKKIQPMPRDGEIPLSSSQLRLWFLEKLAPGDIAYTIPTLVQFEGKLDATALEKSLNAVIRRHESLRTTFSNGSANIPVQVIHPPFWMALPIQDVSDLPDSERETAGLAFIKDQTIRPFDLENGPLIRANLIRLSDRCHWLFVNLHHIISDGWSTGILFAEISMLYQAFSQRQISPLPELPVQFADYVLWQRQSATEQILQAQLAYWQKKLSGNLPILELPADFSRPKQQTTHGATYRRIIPAELSTQLKMVASKQAVTLFHFLQAAFSVLLNRYTGLEDILVGTANANRSQQAIENLIGFFVNTLPLRFNLAGNPAFTDLLKQVREVSLETFANQAVPFENIVEAVHPDRDSSHTPIFQVMFILQNTPMRAVTFSDLKASPIFFDNGTAKYDLTLMVWEDPEEGLTCIFEYNSDLFTEETIKRFAGHYLALLQSACTDPTQPINRLQILTEFEREQVLVTWNATQFAYPRQLTLPTLFEVQAARTPQATAVVDEHNQIQYLELEERANRLAHHLISAGVQPETLVGVSLPRSIDLVVALLAIQKAGGAYLPLDPHFPADRLAYMLEDSRTKFLITKADLAFHFQSGAIKTICLDLEREAIASQDNHPTHIHLNSDHLAYVLYTSGSTGRPKGVQVTQRNLLNFLYSMQRQPGLSARDVLLSVTTLSFDIAGLELYLPLITGAQLVLVSFETAADGQRLKQALENHQATVMQATPATWRLLIAAGWQGSKTFKVLCGGEALPADLAANLLLRCGSLWNMYGPTETTIWSTFDQVTSADQQITIGRPIANTQIYILDKEGQPVPIGIPGELHIGGDGVARGYLNRPDLTAEKFIRDPFSKQPGARLYRTGDLARYLASGRIDFLGRMDNQVKLRGFRIELGEIETCLAQHPGVHQAVVIVREDTPGDKRLAAYLTSQSLPPTAGELRTYLQETLPEYMLPAHFIFMESLPLTPNGKIDRRALPEPEASRPALVTDFAAAQSETEKKLALIWQQALKVERVGIDDNFFELGGHSLLIVQVHQQVRAMFETGITIAQMFQYPTIRTLAQYLTCSPTEQTQQLQTTLNRAALQREAIQNQERMKQIRGGN